MKKTSFIILGLCALALIASAVAPAVMFDKIDIKFNILKASGEPVKIETDMFVSLSVTGTKNVNPDENITNSTRRNNALIVKIHESDSVVRPCIIMDKNWADNLIIRKDPNGLNIDIDLHSLRTDSQYEETVRTLYDEKNRVLADIIIPRDMLHTLHYSDVFFDLSDFTNSSLTLYPGQAFNIRNSVFGELSTSSL